MNYQIIAKNWQNMGLVSIVTIFLLYALYTTNSNTLQQSIAQEINSSSTSRNYNNDVIFDTYENDTMGIKIQYPVGWNNTESESKRNGCEGSVCVAFDFQRVQFATPLTPELKFNNFGVISITVYTSSHPMSYQDWLTWTLPMMIKGYQQNGVNLTQNKETSIANLPAHELVIDNGDSTTTTMTLVHNKKQYSIQYTISKNGLSEPIIQHMIESFELLNSSNSDNQIIKELE